MEQQGRARALDRAEWAGWGRGNLLPGRRQHVIASPVSLPRLFLIFILRLHGRRVAGIRGVTLLKCVLAVTPCFL